ncbi:uncharacterized protein LOC128547883 [Mercenaria mercenaria]|uniref:uncharacterized protein LOC128547883 n=1 Tax=Mercenaria mercenaria TaxID=6596 RepID=UPI00234E446B|nr:uncharacterized protein LOC128547883 [Mercenaria mercenaria]
MGPIYFATLRKVQIFGVRIDGYPRQLNFLVDENETIGQDGTQTHGPNAVISMLDYVLDEYSQHEPKISLHADNCPGQNKNRYLLGYLMWRILTGRQDSIEYLMQVPGHAKCLVDAGFGHLKKLYRRSNIETMDQLGDVVRLSSATNQEVRYPAWQWADWKSYLTPMFKSVHGIRKYQSFSMTIDEPGVVTMQTGKNTPEVKVNICTGIRVNDDRPTTLQPKGQSRQRVEYQYKNVRKYLNPVNMDITCPQPAPR